jgi:ribosomal protein L40E
MIICGQCGERNLPEAQFCRACQAFLEWEGDRADEPVHATASTAEPVPLQPAEPAPQPSSRPSEVPDHQPLSPGDLICGQCGTGNIPTRRFCRRCAAPLADAVVVRPPWWRRLLPRRRRRVRQSGERPRKRRTPVRAVLRAIFRGLRWAVVSLLVLAVLGYGLLPSVRGWVNPTAATAWHKAKSVVSPNYVPARPTAITSNGALPDHPPALVSDTITTTYWAVREGGPEPALVFTFERPVNLKRVIVHNGAAQNFQNAHRARQLHLVFSTGQTADLTLRDSPDPQTLTIPGSPGANRVEIHIVSLYHAVRGTDLAVAEIELFEQPS